MKPAEAIWERRTRRFQARQLGRPTEREGKLSRPDKKIRERCLEGLGLKGKEIEQVEPRKEHAQARGTLVIIDKQEALEWAEQEEEEGEIRFFTDGSLNEKGEAGAGVVFKKRRNMKEGAVCVWNDKYEGKDF